MASQRTTAAIQSYLDELASRADAPAEPIVRELLGCAAQRLYLLCSTMLSKSYPRLTRHPVNMHATEMLSAVVERMLKALRKARPGNVRQFFYIASQHMRWELNEVARRLDQGPRAVELCETLVAQPPEQATAIGPKAVRILAAIERLPEEYREVFDLIRIQGMTQPEAAELLGVSVRTVQRRLNTGILMLTEELADLRVPVPRSMDSDAVPR
jgi:RNA polymerase sigma factor (sigma-70 family)